MPCDRQGPSGGFPSTRDLGALTRRAARSGRPARALIRALICALPLSACAVSYVDDDGNQHVIGFANIVIAPSTQDQPTAGNVVDLTTIGLSLNSMPDGQSLSLGYSRAVTATLKNNVLVLGDPLAIREQIDAHTENAVAAIPDYDGGCDVCAQPLDGRGDDGLR